MAEPTLYDPKIHGEMTDGQRRRQNKEILDSIPERNEDDLYDRLMFASHTMRGEKEKAEQYRAGAERDKAWVEVNHQKRKRILATKKEIEAARATDKRCDQILEDAFKQVTGRKTDVSGLSEESWEKALSGE